MLNCRFPLRILLRKAPMSSFQSSANSTAHSVLISDLQSLRRSTAQFYSGFHWERHRSRAFRALGAAQLYFYSEVYRRKPWFGPPELWKLRSSFLLKLPQEKASSSDLQRNSSFRLRSLLRKASILDSPSPKLQRLSNWILGIQSPESSTAYFY